ncbi:MAG: hypothetical protein LBR29_09730 [Methylobacteriaceae bacterium]|jgi:hypothetical protein|nr:hypothetical protein [Methylobacteriaceae bacterium]
MHILKIVEEAFDEGWELVILLDWKSDPEPSIEAVFGNYPLLAAFFDGMENETPETLAETLEISAGAVVLIGVRPSADDNDLDVAVIGEIANEEVWAAARLN